MGLLEWFTSSKEEEVIRKFKSKKNKKLFSVTAEDFKRGYGLDTDGNIQQIVAYVRNPKKKRK